MMKTVDVIGCPIQVGDSVICCKGGQGDTELYVRDVLNINDSGNMKIRGFSKLRQPCEVLSIKPHHEMYLECFI